MIKIWYDDSLKEVEIDSMQTSVSIARKRHFLKWLNDNYNKELEEIDWFIQDLIEDTSLLLNLHFVQDIKHCPKGIIISTNFNRESSFIFFKGAIYTDNVYTAYHEFRLYSEEAIYIQVNFPNQSYNRLYQSVLEDELLYKEKDQIAAEKFLQQLLISGEITRLESGIDNALENNNYKQFILYTNQLKKLKRNLVENNDIF